jgi:hypothetical protein
MVDTLARIFALIPLLLLLYSFHGLQYPLYLFFDMHPLPVEVLELQGLAPGLLKFMLQFANASRKALVLGNKGLDPFLHLREFCFDILQGVISCPAF